MEKTRMIKINSQVVTILFFLILICFSLDAVALEIADQEVAVTLTESFASRHICEAQDSFPENDPIWESTLDIEVPKVMYETDLSFSFWWGYPLKAGSVTAEEIDYSVAISRDLTKTLKASIGYNYCDFPKANRNSDFNKFLANLTLAEIPNLPISISFNLYAAYQFEAAAEGSEDGWYYSWGFGTELPLSEWRIFQKEQSANIEVANWGNDGVAGSKPSSLYATECSISTDYSFWEFTITPSFNYVFSYENSINSEDEIWGRIDVSYAF